MAAKAEQLAREAILDALRIDGCSFVVYIYKDKNGECKISYDTEASVYGMQVAGAKTRVLIKCPIDLKDDILQTAEIVTGIDDWEKLRDYIEIALEGIEGYGLTEKEKEIVKAIEEALYYNIDDLEREIEEFCEGEE